MSTKQLHQKYVLPEIASLGTKSPTLQRIKLEEKIIDTFEVLRADIETANQYVQDFEATKEVEVAYRTTSTLTTFDHIRSIIPIHTASRMLGEYAYAGDTDESRLLWAYGFSNQQQLESVIENITLRGLRIIGRRKVSADASIIYVLNGSEAELRKLIDAYHAKALDEDCAKHQAKLDEAKFQFEMFKKHQDKRLKEIVEWEDTSKALCKSPVLK